MNTLNEWSVITLEDWAKIRRLAAEGVPKAKTASRLGISSTTVINVVRNDAANLFFQLVSSRYEHASLILTSTCPSAVGAVFGDQAVAAAMVDRIVHHADVLTVKGDNYRPRGVGIDTLPSIRTTTDQQQSQTGQAFTIRPPEVTRIQPSRTPVNKESALVGPEPH